MADKKLSVLIIEDEQIYRTLALQVFEGCDKIIAANAEEGLAKFKEFCPDITLLDIGLPDKNGLDLLPELISYDPEAFIIMLTMSRISDDVKVAMSRGAAGYILKPFSYQKVSQCVAKYKEYKQKLQAMTPEERAGKLIQNLKSDALKDDLKINIEEKIAPQPKTNLSKIEQVLQSWKIIFADSIAVNRERASVQLAKLECHIEMCESSEDVLNKAKNEYYDVILVDSKISGIGGYEVAKELRKYENSQEAEKSILIIMLEDQDELDRHLWQKAGMNDFIKKPASFTKLRETVLKHVKRHINYTDEEYVN